MASSDSLHNETQSDNDKSEDNSEDSSREYSESSILSADKEFGPERSVDIANSTNEDKLSLPWVHTFKERVDKSVSRLLNDNMKFCTSGKMNAPPITSISLLKVGDFFLVSHCL